MKMTTGNKSLMTGIANEAPCQSRCHVDGDEYEYDASSEERGKAFREV